jgi:hypothetical protein
VVQGVAHEVEEGIDERIEQRAIDADLLSRDLEVHLLAELVRQIADATDDPVSDGLEGDEAHLDDVAVELAPEELAARGARPGLGDAPRLDRRGEPPLLEHQIEHLFDEGVEHLRPDAQPRGRGLRLRVGRVRGQIRHDLEALDLVDASHLGGKRLGRERGREDHGQAPLESAGAEHGHRRIATEDPADLLEATEDERGANGRNRRSLLENEIDPPGGKPPGRHTGTRSRGGLGVVSPPLERPPLG